MTRRRLISKSPPGTKTFEIAFALVVQDVPKSIDGSLFLIDDAMVIAQYP